MRASITLFLSEMDHPHVEVLPADEYNPDDGPALMIRLSEDVSIFAEPDVLIGWLEEAQSRAMLAMGGI